jgi:hypothetical protein
MDARFANYLRTKKMIDEAPPSIFEMKINNFADRSDEEKQAMLTMFIGNGTKKASPVLGGTYCQPGFFEFFGTCLRCKTAGCKYCPFNICS